MLRCDMNKQQFKWFLYIFYIICILCYCEHFYIIEPYWSLTLNRLLYWRHITTHEQELCFFYFFESLIQLVDNTSPSMLHKTPLCPLCSTLECFGTTWVSRCSGKSISFIMHGEHSVLLPALLRWRQMGKRQQEKQRRGEKKKEDHKCCLGLVWCIWTTSPALFIILFLHVCILDACSVDKHTGPRRHLQILHSDRFSQSYAALFWSGTHGTKWNTNRWLVNDRRWVLVENRKLPFLAPGRRTRHRGDTAQHGCSS